MDYRRISDEYTEIGHELINTMPELAELKNADVQIIFLASEHVKKHGGNIVFGQCEKVPDKYKWGIPCDFTITIFEPNVTNFSVEQLWILLFHELLHVGVFEDKLYVRQHDLEDFKIIIEKYGVHWSDETGPEFVASEEIPSDEE